MSHCPTCEVEIPQGVEHVPVEVSIDGGDPHPHCFAVPSGGRGPRRSGNAGGRSRAEVERILREEFGQR